MGLFGNNNETQRNEENEEKKQKQQEAEELEKRFAERKKFVEDHPGILVKIKLKDGISIREYKFYVEDEAFVFMFNINLTQYYDPTKYEKILSIEDIRLDKQTYKAELIRTENKEEQSKEYDGELIFKQEPIEIKFFAPDHTGLIISIYNLRQDFSSVATFMQELGVKNYRNIIDIPEEVFTVKVIMGEAYFAETDYITFRQENRLFFVRELNTYHDNNVCIIQIDIDKILYYKSEGSLRYEQQVTGGGGAGINYGGAVVGGLLFGGVGAMIGSRTNEEVKEIETKTVTHDDRIVSLALHANGENYQIAFDLNSEMVFDWLIPEKQYDYVISKRREKYEKGEF